MKKHIVIVLMALALVVLTSCGAKMTKNSESISQDSSGYGVVAQRYDADGAAPQEETPTKPVDVEFERKIIKNGMLNLETEDVEKTYSDIINFVKEHDGYETKNQKNTSDSYITITLQIKIKPESLELLMNYAGTTAEVINSKVTSDDVTTQYYDTQIRLDTMKSSLAQYYKLLEKAITIEEILQIQSEINRITTEIEAMQGKIKMWDVLASESTVDITINQKNDPLKPQKEIKWNALTFKDMGMLIKSGFIGAVNFLVAIFQWIAIALLSASPLLILVGIVLLIVLFVRKKKRAKVEKKDTGEPPKV